MVEPLVARSKHRHALEGLVLVLMSESAYCYPYRQFAPTSSYYVI